MSIDAAKARLERAREVQTATACSIDQALRVLHHIEMEKAVSTGAEEICERLLRFEEEFSRETSNIAQILRGIRDGVPDL